MHHLAMPFSFCESTPSGQDPFLSCKAVEKTPNSVLGNPELCCEKGVFDLVILAVFDQL